MTKINVITLWNTGRYFLRWNKVDINHIVTEEYVDYRLKILEEITLPSLENQTNKDFNWLIFCNTKSLKFGRFYNLVKSLKPTIIDTSNVTRDIDRLIKRVLTSFNGDVIELKLDSDDAISKHFIEVVRRLPIEHYRVYYPKRLIVYLYEIRKFVEYDDCYMNFPIVVKSNNKENWIYELRHFEYRGFAKYINDDRIFYVYTQHRANHHITLCNDINKFYKHFRLNSHKKIKYLEEEVPWLVHQRKKVIQEHFEFPYTRSEILKLFSINSRR